MSAVHIPIDTKTLDGYDLFVKCKKLPRYKVVGNDVVTDEKSYNYVFGGKETGRVKHKKHGIEFDYQGYVVQRALDREKFAAFLDCGLGKTIIELLFANDVIKRFGGKALIWCPLSVLEDVQREHVRLFGSRMSNLRNEKWKTPIAILNYESMREVDMKDVVCCVLDESSILKSGDGATCDYLTRLASNVRFRLACSATPSPNDQTEYASHAVFLGLCATQKEFYSKFFVKDGTEWRMKAHAKDHFYDYLRSWACYIQSPSSIGFERGAELPEEPNYIIQESYPAQKYFPEGVFLGDSVDLQFSRTIFGSLRCDTGEKRFIQACEAVQGRRSIIWCSRNKEEEAFYRALGGEQINGSTEIERRIEIIDAFKRGEIKHIISKPSVLGFGVNIQEAEAHLYSGFTFSFEQFYQAVRRSHRFGRVGRLDVIVPVSEPEKPVWAILEKKLKTFKCDVAELQRRFFHTK